MLNAAMRTYCRLLAANPGPARALVVASVGCPAIRKIRAECLTAWAQLMEALVAERRPDRPVPRWGVAVASSAKTTISVPRLGHDAAAFGSTAVVWWRSRTR
jgi:hypothetical protein